MTTKTKGKVAAACVLAALIALASTECQRLRANLDSYDQRYSDCMEYKKSWLPAVQQYWTDEHYQQEAADCERRAANGGPLW